MASKNSEGPLAEAERPLVEKPRKEAQEEEIPTKRKVLGHAALLVAQLLSCANIIFSRMAYIWKDEEQILLSPITFAVVRCVMAFIIFTVIRFAKTAYSSNFGEDSRREQEIIFLRKRLEQTQKSKKEASDGDTSDDGNFVESRGPMFTVVSWEDTKSMIFLGFMGISVHQLLYQYGVALTGALIATAFMASTTPFSLVIAHVLKVDRLSIPKVFSVLLVVAGDLIMIRVWAVSPSGSGSDFFFGVLSLAASMFAWSFYLVKQKGVVARIPSRIEYLFRFYAGGAIFLIIVGAIKYRLLLDQLFGGRLSKYSWIAMFYAGAINSTFQYYLLAFAITICGPVVSAAYYTMQPAITSLLAYFILDEPLGFPEVTGGVFVIGSIVLCIYVQNRDEVKRRAEAAKSESGESNYRSEEVKPLPSAEMKHVSSTTVLSDDIPLNSEQSTSRPGSR